MEFLLPYAMQIAPRTIGADLIGVRPALQRHLLEQRNKKINNILKRNEYTKKYTSIRKTNGINHR